MTVSKSTSTTSIARTAKRATAAATVSDSAIDAVSPAKVRDRAGLTKTDMADLLGMSEYGYLQWESGLRRPGGPAFRLLHLIDRKGADVIEMLRDVRGEKF